MNKALGEAKPELKAHIEENNEKTSMIDSLQSRVSLI